MAGTDDALAHAVEGNLLALLRAIAALPGSEVEDGEHMLRFATKLPSPMHNAVAATRLEPGDVEAAVHDAQAWYRQRGVPFFWWTGPSSTPADLPKLLMAAGLKESGLDWPGMAVAVDAVDEGAATPDGVTVDHVADEPGLQEWSRTFCAAFGVPAFAGDSWVEAARRLEFGDLPWQHYLAKLDDESVGVSLSFEADGVVGLYGVGTVEAARRRGVGGAATVVPMLDALARGCSTAILHSTPEGEPLYRKLGFVEHCRISRLVGGT